MVYYPVELRISHLCKRVVYFQNSQQRAEWIPILKAACNQSDITKVYSIGEFIAEGSFGKVFKGNCIENGMPVAVKVVSKQYMQENELAVQTNEIEILKVCDHPNVVRLLDHFED